MSHYLDNQTSWEWHVDSKKAVVVTDHGTHTHTLDLTDVSVGELSDNPGKVLGDAHRAAPHDFKTKEESEMASEKNSFLERIRCDQATIDKVNAVSRNSNQPVHRTAEVTNDGGRERGDEGPGSLGRESGLKGESANEAGTTAASGTALPARAPAPAEPTEARAVKAAQAEAKEAVRGDRAAVKAVRATDEEGYSK